MWNLSGDDVEQAKEQLKGRRAAIKARYDDEMKRVDDALAEIGKFEVAAQEFVSQYKGEETPSETAAETEPVVEEPSAISEVPSEKTEPTAEHQPVEEPTEVKETVEAAEAAAEPTGSSRWRLRLNGNSATAAA